MREREAQYRSIFEVVTDGILIIDLEDGRLVEVNPRAYELFGYTREEFLGRVMKMMVKERVMGVLNLSSQVPHSFTSRHAALGIANQAAIAIKNARLYAQELAAMEERQKLARQLHDSVSQALYGTSLEAHATRTILGRDPEHVAGPLDYILSLAEATLAEMRALIFELRPESLETEGLASVLSKQAIALQAQHEIVVSTELRDEPDLSLRAKQAVAGPSPVSRSNRTGSQFRRTFIANKQ